MAVITIAGEFIDDIENATVEEIVAECWDILQERGGPVTLDGVDVTKQAEKAFLDWIGTAEDDILEHHEMHGAPALIEDWDSIIDHIHGSIEHHRIYG